MYTFTLIGIAASRAGSGKSTVANALIQKADFVHVPFAGPLKRIGTAVLVEAGFSEIEARRFLYHDKHSEIPGLGVTGRHLLQTLGTDWGRRQINPTIWRDLWARQVNTLRKQAWREARECRIVVDDVRFPNEAELIRKMGGFNWLIERPRTREESLRGLRQRFSPFQLIRHPQRLLPWKLLAPLHASEGGLNGYRHFSARIRNDGTIHDLLEQSWRELVKLHPSFIILPAAGGWIPQKGEGVSHRQEPPREPA